LSATSSGSRSPLKAEPKIEMRPPRVVTFVELALTPRRIPPTDRYFSPNLLQRYADELGLNPTQLAEHLEVSKTMIYYLLAGDRGPTLETYLRMAAAAGEPLGSWITGIGPRTFTPFS
jgi:DNA-binding XRE family transcriptional regulator